MKYRAEIDGLRAVAVLPVIFFHAGFFPFSGGFVGVDVFFVISGYLITTILMTEISEGRFSLLSFYERRARRILPALIFVCACCIPFAWLWMLPAEFKYFSEALIAVALFYSNIFFIGGAEYFAPAVDLNPLLHTWSLAVEEQFYILFPLLLMGLLPRSRKATLAVLVLLSVASLALAEYGWRHFSSANFYLLPTRAWELGIGALCAFALARPEPLVASARLRGALAALGLMGIAGAAVLFDGQIPFPSLWALIPVLGTAMIILFAGQETLVGRLLSNRVLVGIGLLSYSAYLWHQPLFAFARIRFPRTDDTMMIGLSIASFVLAYLTWLLVETPFRQRRARQIFNRATIFASSAVGLLALGGFGLWGHLQNGAPMRFATIEQDVPALEARVAINFGLHHDCEDKFSESPNCRTAEDPEFLLWGDSYAMHLAPGLIASEAGLKLQQQSKSSCAPLLDMSLFRADYDADWRAGCFAFNDQVMAWLEANPSVRYVVLSSPFGIVEDGAIGRDGIEVPEAERISRIIAATSATLERIRRTGARVVLISPTPSPGFNVGNCLTGAALFGYGEDHCDFFTRDGHGDQTLLVSLQRLLGKSPRPDALAFLEAIEPDLPIIWLSDMICSYGLCDVVQEGRFIYRDSGHLSKEGSAYLGERYDWAELVRATAR
ncbi:Peptidoglycan/LPS O-acetylase OafA/YrhL, contains acyltransferase and SGNH-hydrolase domains [Devosia enhydra]|uniref:Peptidoglycan/LPS O-acetylase OafA/YrhL, contains acyltransferase and SGNH-hydrolase domains n=1 Tax=Devosia enhydra TaxID=665118 RepID=A0A1K2I4V0_9HYPH|nr:acyltransferase family protein [Devosia enhydra]SFZ86756.1 Peptidoglycan/LPS O-acetylase OafA/YrhL, contains acyltransferase and SGNH-hydrolase domains [Devosia enhydra]